MKDMRAFSIFFCVACAMFVACSGNGSTDAVDFNSGISSDSETGSSSSKRGGYGDEDSAGSGDVDADSVYDGMKVKNENYLPECSKSREGISVYVRANDETLECKSSEWVKVESGNEESSNSNIVKSSNSRAGSSSSVILNSSTSVIPSGGEGSSSSRANGKSSSSLNPGEKVAWQYLNPNISYGEMTDDRDGQVYKTVTIGKQTWMAENLNYAYTGVKYLYGYNGRVYTSDSTSWCYNNDADSCAKYGRLYTWSAAMDSAAVFSETGKGCGYEESCNVASIDSTIRVRGVCPQGWHLPSDAEWEELFTAVGGKESAGFKLKSTSGWYKNGNGWDSYGFGVLPAGYRYGRGYFHYAGSRAYFWSSTERSSSYAYYWNFYYDYGRVSRSGNDKDSGYSVRCAWDLD